MSKKSKPGDGAIGRGVKGGGLPGLSDHHETTVTEATLLTNSSTQPNASAQ